MAGTHPLEYYRTKGKCIEIVLKEKDKSQHRDKFDKRWHCSGLKSLKEKTNSGRQKAAIVYDQWLESKEIAEKRSKTITESEWRGYILSYYISKHKSVLKFLNEANLTRRGAFLRRWKLSGLKEAKDLKVTYDDAKRQYDTWFEEWKPNASVLKKENSSACFPIHVDGTKVGEGKVKCEESIGEAVAKLGISDGNSKVCNKGTHQALEDGSSESDGKV